MDAKKHLQNSIKMTMKKEDIMPFINDLHNKQLDMIEAVVASKERQGFPEASVVIKHIMEKK